ncbi:MAG: sarcosine oxidase subunit gamma family protein [Pseudomonadales bacterium]
MYDVAVFDQSPGQGAVAESPLVNCSSIEHELNPGITITEQPFLGYLALRGNAADEGFRQGVEKALSTPLPVTPLRLNQHASDGSSIQWVSPDEWLIVVEHGKEYAIEVTLRDELSGHFSIVNISGGHTLLTLSGPAAREVLCKSTTYDVHSRNFTVGKAVSTNLGKATTIIRRPSGDVWELIIRRSFANYCWRWLIDASQEFGVYYR